MTKKYSSSIIAILYVMLLFVSFFEINTAIKDVIFALLFISFSAFYLHNRKKTPHSTVTKVRIKILKSVTVLMLLFLITSVITLISNNLSNLVPDNLITIGMILISLFTAFLCNDYFGPNNIKYICIAIIINYLITVIFFSINTLFGIPEQTYNFLGLQPIATLEIHELAFIAGAMLTYLLFSRKYKKMPFVTLAILAITILDFKRISLVAFVIIGLIALINKLFIKNLDTIVRITKIITYIVVFTYLALMTVFLDQTLVIISNLGINMSWRDHFYRMIYTARSPLSPVLGTGIRSTDYRMSIDSMWNFIGAIHSDILRLFLENGIVLFSLYMITYISYIPKLLKKICDSRAQLTYSFLTLFTLTCYMTDNLFTYYRFVFVFFSIVFALTNIKQKEIVDNVQKNVK